MYPFINIHTHKISPAELSIVNLKHDDIILDNKCYSFGIHPWEIGKIDEPKHIEILNTLCGEKKIIAVGEIGLDRAIKTSLELQKTVFTQQLDIAGKHGLPVIIHGVRANSDLLQVRKNQKAITTWIIHGFKGRYQDALQLMNKQCFISIGASLLTNSKMQKLIKQLPINSIFFETDDANISIEKVYSKASELLNLDISKLKEQIYSNFKKVFLENDCRMVK